VSEPGYGTHDGECCESCMQDIEEGYGDDIQFDMCCCRALKEFYNGTLAREGTDHV